MSPTLRRVLLVVSAIFFIVAGWQYFNFTNAKQGEGYSYFWIGISSAAIACGSLLAFFLTKPEDDPSDISITKF